MLRVLRAYPTMFRVGLADLVAYRSEFLIWMLTTNLPLIMLAVWHAAAEDGPLGQWGQERFIAYYLLSMVVRLVTGNWVMWEITMEVWQGTLAMRLLRPIHPLWMYSAEQVAAVPMRLVMILPVVAVLWHNASAELTHDVDGWVCFALAVAGSWVLQFFAMCLLGLTSLYVESAFGIFEVWAAVSALLGGYLVPLELLPAWIRDVASVMPFRFMLALPVEAAMGLPGNGWEALAAQWAWVAAFAAGTLVVFRHGEKRFASYGG